MQKKLENIEESWHRRISMNEKTITTIYCEREYDHGTVEVTSKSHGEWNTEIKAHLTVSSSDYEAMFEEIQAVIRKYAL